MARRQCSHQRQTYSTRCERVLQSGRHSGHHGPIGRRQDHTAVHSVEEVRQEYEGDGTGTMTDM